MKQQKVPSCNFYFGGKLSVFFQDKKYVKGLV